jgi:hypothetical protein
MWVGYLEQIHTYIICSFFLLFFFLPPHLGVFIHGNTTGQQRAGAFYRNNSMILMLVLCGWQERCKQSPLDSSVHNHVSHYDGALVSLAWFRQISCQPPVPNRISGRHPGDDLHMMIE